MCNLDWLSRIEKEWQELFIVIDSGAGISACPPTVSQQLGGEHETILNGVEYTAAGGHKIEDLGIKAFLIQLENGTYLKQPFRMSRINRPLWSAKDLCSQGFRVVFDSEDPDMLHKSPGSRVKIHKRNRVYGVWVRVCPKDQFEKLQSKMSAGFHRPALRL